MGCSVRKGMAPTKNKELKARLEHKLYLARENPEPVFDLSECDLKQIPQGVFSLCKVFRKEALLLHENRLTGLENGGSLNDLKLLAVLDLHKNLFIYLPPSINALTNLRELYLNNNRLKTLPDAICDLYNLEILNLNDNCLKKLPDNLGDLIRLKEIFLCDNSKLTELPYSFCMCKNLIKLELDLERIKEPPQSVTENGADCVRKYFAEKHNIVFEKDETDAEQRYVPYEKDKRNILSTKAQKEADYLAFEKQNDDILKQELALREAEKLKKDKFLKYLMAQQDRIELEVKKFQKLKDEDRKKFVDKLLEVEQETDSIVKQLLEMRHSESFNEQYALLQNEEEEKLLQIFQERNEHELRKRDVLLSMEQMLLKEDLEFFMKRNHELDTVKNNVIESEAKTNNMIDNHLCLRETRQNELIEMLQNDEKMQKECLLKLLSTRNDCESWCLVQRLRLVENQLADLTKLELEKKKIQYDSVLNDLSEMRWELAAHLVELMAQRDSRKRKLVKIIQDIDREQEKYFAEDLWLVRYQTLMDSMPECFHETNLDVILMKILLTEGLLSYLPYFGRLMEIVNNDTLKITLDYIREAGVKNVEVERAIMQAILLYNKEIGKLEYSKVETTFAEPTAPSMDLTPSCSKNSLKDDQLGDTEAKFDGSECVICMDRECQIIFIPCGHLCCCIECSSVEELVICPMCRADIAQKVKVVVV